MTLRPTAHRVIGRIAVLSAFCASIACSEPPRPKAEPQPLVVPKKDPVPQQPNADELPVPEDFELDAEREITRSNMRTELDTLEREIEGKSKPR